MKKLKVAYICHVSNATIRENIPLGRRFIYNVIERLRGRKPYNFKDYSIHNSLLCENAGLLNNVELHVITPFGCLGKNYVHFEHAGVHYHVFDDFRFRLAYRLFYAKKNIFHRYDKNSEAIVRIINEIKPDLINMIGAEGPFFNASLLYIDTTKYPVILSMQTALSDPDFPNNFPISVNDYKERCEVEQALMKHVHYIGHDSSFYRSVAKLYNPELLCVRHSFLTPHYDFDVPNTKDYDFVYYAADIVKAGREAAEAFGRASIKKRGITLNIIGAYSNQTYSEICDILRKYNCLEFVTFSGYFPSHEDALKQVVKSKYALIPIKIDLISGTIVESMLLGLPVITFRTKGTPQMNDDGISVLLSDIDDFDSMADNMLKLIDNTELQSLMRKNSRAFYKKIWQTEDSVTRLSRVYHSVYNHFHTGQPIPEDLLKSVY